jgi:hypothetical protein
MDREATKGAIKRSAKKPSPFSAVISSPILSTEVPKLNVPSTNPQRYIFSFLNSKSAYEYEKKKIHNFSFLQRFL